MMERLRAGRPVDRLCRQTCAVQPAHGSRLLSGIADVIGRQLLLGFKHRIYAFRRYDIGAFEREHEWRILSVVDDHVDLLAEDASAIDYKSFAGFIYAGQIVGKDVNPDLLAGVALDRKSVVWGKSVAVRVDRGGRSIIKKKK